MTQRTPETYNRYLKLLNDHEKQIQNYCVSHSDSRFEACTLMQEVLENVWHGFDTLDADSTARQVNRWLQRVMYTTFVSHLRHWHRSEVMVPLEEAESLAAGDDDNVELIQALLMHLSPDERQIVEQHLQGYTHAEIAERNQLTRMAVAQRIHRIIQKLKKLYQKYYE